MSSEFDISYTNVFSSDSQPFESAAKPVADIEDTAVTVPECPRQNTEKTANMVCVYSTVKTQSLAAIAKDGLLRSKNSVSKLSPKDFETVFFVEKPLSLKRFDRTRSIFASPHAPRSDNLVYNDILLGRLTCLEVAIGAQDALVADQHIWDEAIDVWTSYRDEPDVAALQQKIKPYARRYWHTTTLLSDYLLKRSEPYVNPEILIASDIPKEQLQAIQLTASGDENSD